MSRDQLVLSVRWMIDREIAVCGLFNRISRRRRVKVFFIVVSELGDGVAWYALILAMPLIYGQGGVTTFFDLVKVGVVNLMLYKVIKHLTGRPRPCVISTNITVGTAPLDQYSFPSGHTMHAVAFSIIAVTQHPELAWVLVPFSSLVAMSRIVLGLHYPTDVIAGGMIGGYLASLLMTT